MSTDKPGTPRLTVDQVRARVGMLLVNGCRIHGEETALPESWVVLDPAHKGGAVRYVWTEHMIGPGWEPSPECPHAAWHAKVARVTAERDAERARVAELEAAAEDASQIPPLPGDPQGTHAFIRWLLSKPQFMQRRMLLATQEGQSLQRRAEAAEHEAHAALRVRIAGLPALVAADIEAMPISDEARRPMWAIHDEMCARVLSLLTPDPKPSTGDGS